MKYKRNSTHRKLARVERQSILDIDPKIDTSNVGVYIFMLLSLKENS